MGEAPSTPEMWAQTPHPAFPTPSTCVLLLTSVWTRLFLLSVPHSTRRSASWLFYLNTQVATLSYL